MIVTAIFSSSYIQRYKHDHKVTTNNNSCRLTRDKKRRRNRIYVSDSPAFGCAVGVSAVIDADVVACVVDVGVASLDSRTVTSVRRTSSSSSSSSPSSSPHCILSSLLRQPLCNYPLQENHADKKLCYRKQIARELRTQYVDGIYSNFVTLQSGLD